MYETYTHLIYEWLTSNHIADLIESIDISLGNIYSTLFDIKELLGSLLSNSEYFLQFGCFAFFVYLGLKFIRIRNTTL